MGGWVGGWVGRWVGGWVRVWKETNDKQVGNAAHLLLGSLLLGLDVGIILCQSPGHGNLVIMQLLRLLGLNRQHT